MASGRRFAPPERPFWKRIGPRSRVENDIFLKILSEARLKAGPHAHSGAWSASWEGCQLAVMGAVIPPLTSVFETTTGTYNAAELRWENAIVHNDT